MSVLFRRSFRALLVSIGLACAMRAAAQAPWKGDARLDRRVTVEAEGIPVGDLLARLSEKTGVALSARGGAAAEKVIVCAHRRPLRDLLAALAALFDDTWERKRGFEEEPARYELFQGVKARNWEAALARQATERLEAQIAEYTAALSLSAEELSRRPDDDPVREFLSSPNNRVGIQLYSLLTPAQRETLFTSRRLAAPYASLTAEQQRAVTAVMRSIIASLQETAERLRNNPNIHIDIPRLEELADGTVQFRLRRMGGHAVLFLSLPGAGIPLATVDARSLWILPPHGDPYDPQHPIPTEPLPAPSAVRAASSAGAALPDRFRHLADETDFSLLSDYYRSRPLASTTKPTAADADPDTPVGALDALCRETDSLWWRHGNALLFRKRDWYIQKTVEVPDDFVLALAERLKAEDGQPSVADILRLRALTPEQIAGMNSLITPLADESQLDGLHELLALIAALPARRADELFGPGGRGLTASDLTPRMRALLHAFADAQDQEIGEGTADNFTLQITRTVRPPIRTGAPATTQVELRWSLGRASGTYLLFLPHGLPDDHRARLRIELAANERE